MKFLPVSFFGLVMIVTACGTPRPCDGTSKTIAKTDTESDTPTEKPCDIVSINSDGCKFDADKYEDSAFTLPVVCAEYPKPQHVEGDNYPRCLAKIFPELWHYSKEKLTEEFEVAPDLTFLSTVPKMRLGSMLIETREPSFVGGLRDGAESYRYTKGCGLVQPCGAFTVVRIESFGNIYRAITKKKHYDNTGVFNRCVCSVEINDISEEQWVELKRLVDEAALFDLPWAEDKARIVKDGSCEYIEGASGNLFNATFRVSPGLFEENRDYKALADYILLLGKA